MIVRIAAAVLLMLGTFATPVVAASFDCGMASTPFEKAICSNDALSLADESLAKSFATATGGLTKPAVTQMRTEQRGWLDFAQRACTDDAEPITGSYSADASACLVDIFKARSTVLENSRMLGGHRFLLTSSYDALPDPEEVDNPDSYWKVATHEVVTVQLDADDPLATDFNPWVDELAGSFTDSAALSDGEPVAGPNPSADTSVTMSVHDLGGAHRITLEVGSYWYGHGAAHGNYSTSYLHYYAPEAREIVADDIFTGDNWQQVLIDAAWDQLQVEHKEWLQVESQDDIAAIVVDPRRWDLSDDYGLIIQFNPYDVAAYAYGAPTIRIPWGRLDAIKGDSQDEMRYGWSP